MNVDTPSVPGEYRVSQVYASTNEAYCTCNLLDAVAHAVAFTMHTGQTFGVKLDTQMLFSISPNTIDWRRVNANHMLRVKAMAHDLVPNVDIIVPNVEKEGLV